MIKKCLSSIASLKFSLYCFIFIIALVVIGTLSQINSEVYIVKERVFQSFFLYWQPKFTQIKIPVFPGGYSIAGLLLINLLCSLLMNFKMSLKKLGFYLIHFGLFFLISGELLSGMFSNESFLLIKRDNKINYSIEPNKSELSVSILSKNPHVDEINFPESLIIRNHTLTTPNLPFKLLIKKKTDNTLISTSEKKSLEHSLNINQATEGIGKELSVYEIPSNAKKNNPHNTTAWIEIIDQKNQSLGTWLLSNAIEHNQVFDHGGKKYNLAVRHKRHFLPFSVELEKINREDYPGTPIPKTISSLINIYSHTGSLIRSALISMNHPLKYKRHTFYQVGLGKDENESVLKVVTNPFSSIPYLFSGLMIIGFFYHLVHSFYFRNREKK